MHFLVTCKFNMDIITTEKKWRHRLFRRSMAAYSVVSGGMWLKFELIQALMHILVNCKYEQDRIKQTIKRGDTFLFCFWN